MFMRNKTNSLIVLNSRKDSSMSLSKNMNINLNTNIIKLLVNFVNTTYI